jgi:hypothetical protein
MGLDMMNGAIEDMEKLGVTVKYIIAFFFF